MNLGSSIGGNGAAHDDEAIARLLFAGGLLRRRRVRRLLLARLLNEARETGEEPEYEEEEGGEVGGSDHRIARFLIASGLLRRRRMRRMLLAHLLRERHEEVEPEFGEFEGGGGFEAEGVGPSSDHKIARFLIVSGILRRRRLRRMILAHLLRERGEGVEPEFGEFEGGGGFVGEEGPSSEHKLARVLIASGILRRRRLRRMILAHLLRERGEGVEPFVGEEAGFGEGEEIGGGDDRRIVRQLVASGLLRKRRLRRMLLARLLRERGGFGEEGEEMEGEDVGGEDIGWGGGFGRGVHRGFEQAFA